MNGLDVSRADYNAAYSGLTADVAASFGGRVLDLVLRIAAGVLVVRLAGLWMGVR